MQKQTEILGNFPWHDLSQVSAWSAWRDEKIRVSQMLRNAAPVPMDSLSGPESDALAEVKRRCALVNFAVYEVARRESSVDAASEALIAFARQLGFIIAESHRSAGHAGVVALRTSSEESKKGYIPYTKRPLNWHTDGYYNAADNRVLGFILHCQQQASAGGENQVIDPELAYLRLREENPDYINALMHPQAMTIPENREPDGSLRPASVGPVFFPDPKTGRMQMRYTARTRSIEWRDDPVTQDAVRWLRDWLTAGDPLMRRLCLLPGQGIVSNNVLHNRTGFEDGAGDTGQRIMLRIRFHKRAAQKEELHGAA